uniref:BTB/POZ domain-containing protein n=1 Tax=Bursaphelenchus xylophilus TaxID=6326 RepID=A0A1I7SVG0_BURXY
MTCLRDGALDYFHYSVCLPHELDEEWQIWLAEDIVRVLLISNRFLTTFFSPSSNNIDVGDETFRLNVYGRTYFAEDPLRLARLAKVAMREEIRGLSICLPPTTAPQLAKLTKLLFWGKNSELRECRRGWESFDNGPKQMEWPETMSVQFVFDGSVTEALNGEKIVVLD